MDDATLLGLKAALALSPENPALLALLLKALHQRGADQEALPLLEGKNAASFPDAEHRFIAANVCLGAGRPDRALDFLDDSAAANLIRARALLAQGRKDAAAAAYRQAVDANPALEDLDLKAQLTARVREIEPSSGGRKLRVISNDDTDATDIERVIAPPQPPVTFADVGGLEEVKKQIHKRIILPFEKPSLFARFKRQVGGGILLYGPPGCGKTLLARATAGECKAQFLNVAISDVLDMYIGESERKLHALFEKARSSVPAVLFFDELEALAGKRQFSREGTTSKLVSQFLSEMDGFAQDNKGVLILGATNVPWAVDPAFRRPGRFDRVLFVPPPDLPARKSILELLLRHRPTAGKLDVDGLAKKTSGFTGADLKNLVETAVDAAIERSLEAGAEQPLTDADLQAALKEVKPTAAEWLTTARNYARYANESGHYDEVLEFLKKHGKA